MTSPERAAQSPAAWHAVSGEEALRKLDSGAEGLGTAAVEARRASAGSNVLPSAPPLTLGHIILDQFKSPLIYILGAAAGVSVALGEFTDAKQDDVNPYLRALPGAKGL
jgi:magnesium-transporting ATPase (P-type)